MPTRFQVLRRVIIPLVKPGIIAGSILVFIPSLGAYVTPRVLGGGKNMMLGNLIELQFGQGRNWPLGAALAMTLHGHRDGRAARLCPQGAIGKPPSWLAPHFSIRRQTGFAAIAVPVLRHALSADPHAGRLFLQRRQSRRGLGRLVAGAGTQSAWANEAVQDVSRPLAADRVCVGNPCHHRGDDGRARDHARQAVPRLSRQSTRSSTSR